MNKPELRELIDSNRHEDLWTLRDAAPTIISELLDEIEILKVANNEQGYNEIISYHEKKIERLEKIEEAARNYYKQHHISYRYSELKDVIYESMKMNQFTKELEESLNEDKK